MYSTSRPSIRGVLIEKLQNPLYDAMWHALLLLQAPADLVHHKLHGYLNDQLQRRVCHAVFFALRMETLERGEVHYELENITTVIDTFY